MFRLSNFLVFAGLLLTDSSSSCGAVVYTFSALDFGAFQYRSPDFIPANRDVPYSSLNFCEVTIGVCWPDNYNFPGQPTGFAVSFYPSTPLGNGSASDALDFLRLDPGALSSVSKRYYFPEGSFISPGAYITPDLFGFNPGTLTVAVTAIPEPSSFRSLLAGLAFFVCALLTLGRTKLESQRRIPRWDH